MRQQGVQSLESYLDRHPGFVDDCIQQMKVLDINQQTLSMFKADSKDELLSNLGNIFRDGMRHHFRDELLARWSYSALAHSPRSRAGLGAGIGDHRRHHSP